MTPLDAARAALELAAKKCEEEAEKWEGDGVPEPMSRLCAAAIRAIDPATVVKS